MLFFLNIIAALFLIAYGLLTILSATAYKNKGGNAITQKWGLFQNPFVIVTIGVVLLITGLTALLLYIF